MKYPVLLADPGWRFKNYSTIGEGRNPIAHYPCMSREQLLRYPIDEYAAPGCVLFLWVYEPLLPLGLEVLDAWGFTFKTVGFYWIKRKKSVADEDLLDENFGMGQGYWTRGNPEQCWIATRGKHPPRRNKDVRKLIIAPRRQHSRKPEEQYERIERLVKGPYCELFTRQTRSGWQAVGNQTTLFNRNDMAATRRRESGKGAARL